MGRKKLLPAGHRYGKLQVIKFQGVDSRHNSLSLCRCDCGNLAIVQNYCLIPNIKSRGIKSCGCSYNDLSEKKRTVTIGMKFHRLKVIEETKIQKNNGNNRTSMTRAFLCVCKCGKTIITTASSLTRDHVKSCGCLNHEQRVKWGRANVKHGKKGSRIHRIWAGMIARCTNPNHSSFENYGGRGISICERWMKFENFYFDMGDPPSETSIDRIDVNGNYEKRNCRWSTNLEQANNRRTNVFIEYHGIKKTLSQWSRLLNCDPSTLKIRLKLWGIERALTTKLFSKRESLLYRDRKFEPVFFDMDAALKKERDHLLQSTDEKV